jgi:hypothetical protein
MSPLMQFVLFGMIFIMLLTYMFVDRVAWGKSHFRVSNTEIANAERMPNEIRDLLQPWIDSFIDRDFQVVNYQIFHDNLIGKPRYEPYWGLLLHHSSQQIFAGLTAILTPNVRRPVICSLFSYAPGAKLVTTNIEDYQLDSTLLMSATHHLDGATLEELWLDHQSWIHSSEFDNKLERLTAPALLARLDREKQESIELQIDRREIIWVNRQQLIYRYDRWFTLKTLGKGLQSIFKTMQKQHNLK